MKKLLGIFMALCGTAHAGFPGEFSGEAGLEYRQFLQQGAYDNRGQDDLSLVFNPKYSLSWDQNRGLVSISAYMRLSGQDEQRTHADIRELSMVSSGDLFEFRLGIAKVFWGVTESLHLVDVINQTDLVENPDGEQKLGQPMINMKLLAAGVIDIYVLPYFRERTFPGSDGRIRAGLPVDADNPRYLHEDRQKHVDYALRWSYDWRNLEGALSFFKGTDRDPGFDINRNSGMLVPVYGQSSQWALDLQLATGSWLLKTEQIAKKSHIHGDYHAAVSGVEYTFSNVYRGMDIGALYELITDSRKQFASPGFDQSSFVASRVAVNNRRSTEFLAGAIFDNRDGKMSVFRLELSSRINSRSSLRLEAHFIVDPDSKHVFYPMRKDDYLQMSISYFF